MNKSITLIAFLGLSFPVLADEDAPKDTPEANNLDRFLTKYAS